VFSESGLLERINLDRKQDQLTKRIESIQKEKSGLESTLRDYERGLKTESDMLNAGLVGGRDRVLVLRRERHQGDAQARAARDDRPFSMELLHYRVLWIIFSLLVFFFHISRKYHREEIQQDA
jgi:hypothetical protein